MICWLIRYMYTYHFMRCDKSEWKRRKAQVGTVKNTPPETSLNPIDPNTCVSLKSKDRTHHAVQSAPVPNWGW